VDLDDRKLGDFGVLGFSILNLEVQGAGFGCPGHALALTV
jgi:hypothetical protein